MSLLLAPVTRPSRIRKITLWWWQNIVFCFFFGSCFEKLGFYKGQHMILDQVHTPGQKTDVPNGSLMTIDLYCLLVATKNIDPYWVKKGVGTLWWMWERKLIFFQFFVLFTHCKLTVRIVEKRIFGVLSTAERNKLSGKNGRIIIMFFKMMKRGQFYPPVRTQTRTHWHKSSEMMHEAGTHMALRCWDLAFDDFCMPLHLRPWHTCTHTRTHAHPPTHTKQIKWISGTLVLSHWPPNPVLCYPAQPCGSPS